LTELLLREVEYCAEMEARSVVEHLDLCDGDDGGGDDAY
jgi:hypothetical protein